MRPKIATHQNNKIQRIQNILLPFLVSPTKKKLNTFRTSPTALPVLVLWMFVHKYITNSSCLLGGRNVHAVSGVTARKVDLKKYDKNLHKLIAKSRWISKESLSTVKQFWSTNRQCFNRGGWDKKRWQRIPRLARAFFIPVAESFRVLIRFLPHEVPSAATSPRALQFESRSEKGSFKRSYSELSKVRGI